MKRFLSIGLTFLFLINCAWAESAVDNLNKKLAEFHSLTANFQQTVVSDDGSVLQTSQGKMAIMRPGKFFWTVSKPITQELITNGKTLWVYEPDLEQVTIRQLGNNLGETPLILLTKQHAQLQEGFNVQQVNAYQFVLIPKHKQDNFNKIVLIFADGKPQSLQLLNQLGQKTLIQFSNIKINPPVNVKQFNFKVPKGVDVIDQRK